MPIPRRISQNALQAIQPVGLRPDVSGAYVLSDELIGEDEAEFYEEEFSHVGALPSLMPARNSPVLRLVEAGERLSSGGSAGGPQSYPSMEMAAVRPSSDSFSWEDEEVAPMKLDLQMAPTTHTSGLHKAAAFAPLAQPPQSMQPQQPIAIERLSGTFIAAPTATIDPNADPTPGIFAFAGYGIPPEKLSKMPAYALRVMTRRWTLRGDLKIARMRGLPQRELNLYEAAIRCADEGAVTKGIAVVVTSIVGVVGAIAAVAATVL